MRRRLGLVVAVVLLAAAACSRTAASTSSRGPETSHQSPTGAAVQSSAAEPPCSNSPPVRVLPVRNGNEAIPVELQGTGRVTVVLSNQSDEDRCSWLPFAGELVSRGFRVALWDYAKYPAVDELAAIAAAVHRDGGGNVVLMGASKGAKASLVAAARVKQPFVSGVVSLSAESILRPRTDVAQASAGLTVATLLVTARQDPYGSAGALGSIRRGLVHPQVVEVPGRDHGTALLSNATVSSAVLDFLRQQSRSPTW